MKKIKLYFYIIFTTIFAVFVTPAFASEIEVEIINVKINEGSIKVALYVKDGFLKKPFQAYTVEASRQTLSYIFKDVQPGEYAVSVYQDSNGNNKLDTNFLGIPSEPYGISREAKGFMGPPKFEDAKFILSDKQEKIVIKIK